MIEKLLALGFSEKEAKVYLALLEWGIQPASIISKKTRLPKATVLFLFDSLCKKGYVKKSQKGRVFYFYADPNDLKKEKQREMADQQKSLDEVYPLLTEFKSPYTSPPKLLFFEGLEGCRKAYNLLLESKTVIHEFAAHGDLEKMGVGFMKDFISQRVKRKLKIRVLCKRSDLHEMYDRKNKEQCRELKMFPLAMGNFYSSIALFENKVLLLNLYHDPFSILIENEEFSQTMRTIFELGWANKALK